MMQGYQKMSELWNDIQNPQKTIPNEGIFNLPVTTFFNSNKKSLPFWDSNFLRDARWDWFLKNFEGTTLGDYDKDETQNPKDIPEGEPTDDPNNLWMTMANPYIKALGQGIAGMLGGIGIGGIIGGMFGGPLGAIFGGIMGRAGSKAIAPIISAIARMVGSIIGSGVGFGWNQSGKNSLDDNAKRQLPGFMCLLPKDKLEIYIKTLFHMSLWGG